MSSQLDKSIEKIQILISFQEENDQGRFHDNVRLLILDLARRKRKAEEVKSGQLAKRSKGDDAEQLYIGTQVAAKVDKNWILAVVVNPHPIKGKIEVEVLDFTSSPTHQLFV